MLSHRAQHDGLAGFCRWECIVHIRQARTGYCLLASGCHLKSRGVFLTYKALYSLALT